VPLEQLWTLAGPWYGDRLDEGWTPKTESTVERLFTAAGLAGDFWRITAS
jgi:hypothetical protein